jgi:aminopeptidase N
LRFYSTLLGDAPYPATTVAVVEADLPGGHSPPYFVMLNSPLTTSDLVWRNDPAAFQGFPHYFLAHELAHQWWGHAVGWKNYREQWLSEGFAQYFSALYAHKSRGDRLFFDMLKQFRYWALRESEMGPVHLGYRLGRIKGGPRVFRALVYNKGAAVLHMLRRIVGDEAFFKGLRRFYNDHKFQTAGSDDLQRAFELESGRTLDRFFERWIYGAAIPRIAFGSTIADGEVTVRLEQSNELVFDLPVTVTVVQADGSLSDVVIVMAEKRVEQKIRTEGRARQVQFNRDNAAIAEFVAGR